MFKLDSLHQNIFIVQCSLNVGETILTLNANDMT